MSTKKNKSTSKRQKSTNTLHNIAEFKSPLTNESIIKQTGNQNTTRYPSKYKNCQSHKQSSSFIHNNKENRHPSAKQMGGLVLKNSHEKLRKMNDSSFDFPFRPVQDQNKIPKKSAFTKVQSKSKIIQNQRTQVNYLAEQDAVIKHQQRQINNLISQIQILKYEHGELIDIQKQNKEIRRNQNERINQGDIQKLELKSKCAYLQNDLDSVSQMLNKKKKQLSECIQQNQHLKNRNSHLQGRLQQVQRALSLKIVVQNRHLETQKQLQSQIISLKNQIQIERQNYVINTSVTDYQKIIQMLQRKMSNLQQQKLEREKLVLNKIEIIQDLKKDIVQLKANRDILIKQMEILKQKRYQLQNDKQQSDEKIKHLEQNLQNIHIKDQSEKAIIIQKFQAKNKQLVNAIDQLKLISQKYSAQDIEIKQYEKAHFQEISLLKNDLVNIQRLLKEKDTQIQLLNQKFKQQTKSARLKPQEKLEQKRKAYDSRIYQQLNKKYQALQNSLQIKNQVVAHLQALLQTQREKFREEVQSIKQKFNIKAQNQEKQFEEEFRQRQQKIWIKVAALDQQISSQQRQHSQQIKAYEQQLLAKDEKIKLAENQLKNFKDKSISKKQVEYLIEQLKSQVELLKSEINSQKDLITTLKRQNKVLRQQKVRLQDVKIENEQSIQLINKKIRQLKIQISTLEQKHSNVTSELNTKEKQHSQQIKNLRQSFQRQRHQFITHKQQQDNLINSLNKQVSKLKQQLHAKTKQKQQLQEQIEKYQSRITALDQQLSTLQQIQQQKFIANDRKNRQYEQNKLKLQNFQVDKEKRQQIIQQKNKQINQLRQFYQMLQAQNQKLKEESIEMQNNIGFLRACISQNSEKSSQINLQIQKKNDQLEKLTRRLQIVCGQNKQIKTQKQQIIQESQQYIYHYNQIQKQYQKLMRRLSATQETYNTYKQQSQNLGRDLQQKLHNQQKNMGFQIKNLKQKIYQVQSLNIQITKNLEMSKGTILILKEENKGLQSIMQEELQKRRQIIQQLIQQKKQLCQQLRQSHYK